MQRDTEHQFPMPAKKEIFIQRKGSPGFAMPKSCVTRCRSQASISVPFQMRTDGCIDLRL